MDCSTVLDEYGEYSDNISPDDLQAIDDVTRYISDNKYYTYEDLIKHISWYWKNHSVKNCESSPKQWVHDWIVLLIN